MVNVSETQLVIYVNKMCMVKFIAQMNYYQYNTFGACLWSVFFGTLSTVSIIFNSLNAQSFTFILSLSICLFVLTQLIHRSFVPLLHSIFRWTKFVLNICLSKENAEFYSVWRNNNVIEATFQNKTIDAYRNKRWKTDRKPMDK